MKLSDLTPDDRNANRGTERGAQQVRHSLKEFGTGRSILVDKDGRIIAGNKTHQAARSNGLSEDVIVVPSDGSKLVVVQRTDLNLDSPEARALAIADNRSSEVGLEWNTAVLEELGEEIDLKQFWTEEEIEDLFAEFMKGGGGSGGGNGDPDAVPDAPANPKTKLGDVYQLGKHRVMCGSSTSTADIDTLFDGVTPDVSFTDPPYGIDVVSGSSSTGKVGGGGETKFGKVGGNNFVDSKTYHKIENDDSTDTARDFYHRTLEAGIDKFFIWGGNYFTDFLPPSPCWLIWDKQNTGNFADVEMAWTNHEGGAKLYPFLWNGMSRQGDRKSELSTRVHPTQKPVGLFELIFEDFPFETCFDAFLGSGSTLIACEKTGRTCYGMELAPYYVDVIVQRWEEFTGQKAELLT